ncbi:MAG: hypothetical protein ACLS61_16950 [Ruminococcus sp.]
MRLGSDEEIVTWKERFSKFILAVLVVGIIFSCSNIEQVQAASKKGTYYYGTVLNRTKGGKKYGSWQPGTKKVKYTSKSYYILWLIYEVMQQ